MGGFAVREDRIAVANTAGATPPPVLLIAPFLAGKDGRWCYAEDLSARLEGCGLPVRRSSTVNTKIIRLADMIASSLGARGEFGAAIVDVYSGQAFIWAEAAARALALRGKPFIAALHGGNLPEFASRHQRRMKALLGTAAAVVAPSDYLRQAFRVWRADLGLLPNAVDLGLYPSALRASPRAHLMWLRSFHSMYNPAMAIRVLKKISEKWPLARLTMVGMDRGDGSRQDCQRLASELGLGQRVHFAGVIPKAEVGHVLSRGDIFLNTTNVDNAPVSVLEAMACGLCVVSTNAGGVPHLIRDGVDGLLVRAGDEAAMAGRVLQLLEDNSLSTRISREAMTKAREFGWERVLPQWIHLLQRVAPSAYGAVLC